MYPHRKGETMFDKTHEVQVWFVPYQHKPKCDRVELWEVASVQSPALISLMRLPNQVKIIEIAHKVKQEVCYWRPGVRAWSIHWTRGVITELRLYDHSGKLVHYYTMNRKGRLLKYSSQSPNRINTGHKDLRRSS